VYIKEKQSKVILKITNNQIYKSINVIVYLHKYEIRIKEIKMKYSAKFDIED
jgi:hypothetical protein